MSNIVNQIDQSLGIYLSKYQFLQQMDREIFLQSQSDQYLAEQCHKTVKTCQYDQIYNSGKDRSQILPAQCSSIVESTYTKQKDQVSNKDSSKKLGSLLAGKKARERKKNYVQGLETSVKEIQKQLISYEQQIKKTKESLAQALNYTKDNQNSMTYAELRMCIESDDPNQDKINLLLDMIKFRIGASGHQRQAKIQYFFKQLVNTLFPALHRYLMYCSDKNVDIFQEHSIDDFFEHSSQNEPAQLCLPWTKDFIYSLGMSQFQKNELLKLKPKYIIKKLQVKKIISSLKEVKQSIKSQEQVFENMIDQMRRDLKPIQGATWVLFSDKFKYKRQISLENQIQISKLSGATKKIKTK